MWTWKDVQVYVCLHMFVDERDISFKGKRKNSALAGVAHWLENCPIIERLQVRSPASPGAYDLGLGA